MTSAGRMGPRYHRGAEIDPELRAALGPLNRLTGPLNPFHNMSFNEPHAIPLQDVSYFYSKKSLFLCIRVFPISLQNYTLNQEHQGKSLEAFNFLSPLSVK